ncbi:hypothetical protein N1F89_10975 [Aquibium sp. A9E412]|uniref:hypothetical protein n=1 Tax=Aquibium sp. A9E412 TaxID=2976767 RepID=UPI0025AF864C|nr:hypothetical protein [Aquibium sp. A9E412]MDN2566746.1 hypothetical protein [Aquibium sp. A9E412]
MTRIVAAALFALAAAAPAAAQNFPTGERNSNMRDSVTGYLCVTPGCDVVRLPQSNCICEKQNPNEQRLSDLRLECFTRQGGGWVACPVTPRYGAGN